MRPRLASLGLLLIAAAAAAEACSATNDGRVAAGSGGAGAGAAAGGGISLSSGSGGSCPTKCSTDLHWVTDCEGYPIKACPPDQGCSAGGCVPACESAKDNKSTVGCDYYAVDPDIINDVDGACFAAFIVNTWTAPVTIAVERDFDTFGGQSFVYVPTGTGQSITYAPLPSNQLDPGQVAVVFLASLLGSGGSAPASCPAGVGVALTYENAALHGTGVGHAFHITTSAPVVAYDIFPYGGGQAAATSATLLLPTAAWDTNYIAVDAYAQSTAAPGAAPSLDIVAAEDGTQVTISPTAAIEGGPGVPGTGKGQPITYALDKGQVLQFTQPKELVGSPIQSNKPIGVWGAASCLNVPVYLRACDSAHQQIPPVRALGHEYVAVRYRDRFDGHEESPPWRIVAAVDGTVLTYDPAPPPGAPATLDGGAVGEFRAAGPFVVRSQDDKHPFYMAGYMTGCEEASPDPFTDCRGDPEFVNVIPSQQYLSSYVFFTDPTYPETDLVLVRADAGSGFADVTLDCAGVLSGWQPIGSGGKYQFTRVDLVRHDFQPQGNCDNGRHEIHSDAPFGLVVWGWGSAESGGTFGAPGGGGFFSQAVSYAYPAGASVQPINTVHVPAGQK